MAVGPLPQYGPDTRYSLSLVYPGQGNSKHRNRGNSAHGSDEEVIHRTKSLAEDVCVIYLDRCSTFPDWFKLARTIEMHNTNGSMPCLRGTI